MIDITKDNFNVRIYFHRWLQKLCKSSSILKRDSGKADCEVFSDIKRKEHEQTHSSSDKNKLLTNSFNTSSEHSNLFKSQPEAEVRKNIHTVNAEVHAANKKLVSSAEFKNSNSSRTDDAGISKEKRKKKNLVECAKPQESLMTPVIHSNNTSDDDAASQIVPTNDCVGDSEDSLQSVESNVSEERSFSTEYSAASESATESLHESVKQAWMDIETNESSSATFLSNNDESPKATIQSTSRNMSGVIKKRSRLQRATPSQNSSIEIEDETYCSNHRSDTFGSNQGPKERKRFSNNEKKSSAEGVKLRVEVTDDDEKDRDSFEEEMNNTTASSDFSGGEDMLPM